MFKLGEIIAATINRELAPLQELYEEFCYEQASCGACFEFPEEVYTQIKYLESLLPE